MSQNKSLTWVFLTLSYANIFSFPLKAEEVWLRLIKNQANFNQVFLLLGYLMRSGLVARRSGYFFLNQKNFSTLVDLREKRRRYSQTKLKEADKLLRFLNKLPWVRGVAITGSVAVANAKKDDDVDFLIVTTNHSLWLTRLLVTWFAQKQGKRRSFSKEEKNSWCFNLWLTTNTLKVPVKKRSLPVAYDVLQARWVVDKQGLEQSFLKQNAWTLNFLPNFFKFRFLKGEIYQSFSLSTSLWLLEFLLFGPNLIAYLGQRLYMQKHLTREKVGYALAFFHPRDTKKIIYQRWKEVLFYK